MPFSLQGFTQKKYVYYQRRYFFFFLRNARSFFVYVWLCYVFIAVLRLSLVAVHRIPIALASLDVEHQLQ